jgi:hypothetical protein
MIITFTLKLLKPLQFEKSEQHWSGVIRAETGHATLIDVDGM